jgi:hypothetical protein
MKKTQAARMGMADDCSKTETCPLCGDRVCTTCGATVE